MPVIGNEFVKELEAAWDNLAWDRKWENIVPQEVCEFEYVWHAYSKDEVTQAAAILPTLLQEGQDKDGDFIRTAFLVNYSTGLTIVIQRSHFDDDF